MKSKLSISFKRMFIIALILSVLLPTINIPLTVNAADVITEGEAADDGSNPTGDDSLWFSTYATGCGYKGQGVLVYLLERNGGGPVTGTSPKAYWCSEQVKSYELRAQDKYNRYPMVTQWESTGPYWAGEVRDTGGLIHDTNTSNVEAIKTWLRTETGIAADGKKSTKGIDMVYSIWGADVAKRFTREEIILVVEPIVANPFAMRQEYTGLNNINKDSSWYNIETWLEKFKLNVSRSANTEMSNDLKKLVDDGLYQADYILRGGNTVPGTVAEARRLQLIKTITERISGTYIYSPLGDPIAGTSKEVFKYYNNEVNVHSGMSRVWEKCQPGINYFRKAANSCSVIKTGSIVCANANFNLYDGSFNVKSWNTLANIETYSIGMLAMLARTTDDSSGQTTCNEPDIPKEHPAPNESTGNCTIIKTYRIVDGTTGTPLIDKGTYTKTNVTNTIQIEDEKDYEVVGWKTSTSKKTTINALDWHNQIPSIIGDTGNSTGLVTLPDTHKYLYVLLEKPDTPAPVTANYELSQSSITRHININNPDHDTVNGTTQPKLSSVTFTWNFSAHSTSCGGHGYNCSSSNCSNKSWHSCNCGKCPSTCTTDHNGKAAGMGHQTSHTSTCDSHNWHCGGHTDY